MGAESPQTIEIDLEIGIPSEAPCHSDNIGDTIHYGVVVERLRKALSEQHFLLLEALAEYIAKVIREDFGAPGPASPSPSWAYCPASSAWACR